MSNRVVIALAGRRVDAPGATPRFPEDRVALVQQRIDEAFRNRHAGALVASAACGADLLAVEVASSLRMRCRIVLPFAAERFRGTSVTDRPGDWGPRFDVAVAAARLAGDLVTLDDAADDGDGVYLRANEAILDEASALAKDGGSVIAVLVWEGRPRGESDVTAAFAAAARRRDIPVEELLTC